MVELFHRIIIRTLILIILVLSLIACESLSTPLERSSKHFLFIANTYTSSEEELLVGINKAEALYEAMSTVIPASIPLNSKIKVQLNGNLRNQAPYMDDFGTIHLYRYSEDEGGYWTMFAHELVHAIAFDYQVKVGTFEWESLWFYFEGWAEYLAQIVDPDKSGFPLYGFDETVVVGHWVSQYGLKLDSLRQNHEELNFQCQLQSYAMRASWFRYIEIIYGFAAVIDIAYSTQDMDNEYIDSILGEPISVVDSNWRDWVIDRYDNYPNAKQETEEFLQRIKWYNACQ